MWAPKPLLAGLFRSDVWRWREIPVFQPLHTDVLSSFVFRQSIQIGHEDLQASLGSHAGVAVHQLLLIVVEVQIKPCVIREIR
jgi:hypothetical protein